MLIPGPRKFMNICCWMSLARVNGALWDICEDDYFGWFRERFFEFSIFRERFIGSGVESEMSCSRNCVRCQIGKNSLFGNLFRKIENLEITLVKRFCNRFWWRSFSVVRIRKTFMKNYLLHIVHITSNIVMMKHLMFYSPSYCVSQWGSG